MSVLIFIIILSFLVIIHELGHFLMARRAKIKVEEFGLGYPPKAATLKTDKRGTEYTLNWLPFGGFVRLFGEDASVKTNQAVAFYNKPVGVRLLVVVAGAVINFLFGAIAFGAIYTSIGIPTQYPYVKIDEVAPGSPAQKAGIKAGDSFDVGAGGVIKPVKSVDEFVTIVGGYKGQVINLKRQGQAVLVPVYVRRESETPQKEGAVGVVVTDFEMKHYAMWQMPFRGMAYGTKTAVDFGGLLLGALGDMVGKLFHGQVPQDVAGPVGIAYMAQKDNILSGSFLQMLNFAAILSINLSIVNLLPIPALDGGRAAFLVFEAVTKKRVNQDVEQRVNAVGFAVLVMLLILISIRDVRTVAGDAGIQSFVKHLIQR